MIYETSLSDPEFINESLERARSNNAKEIYDGVSGLYWAALRRERHYNKLGNTDEAQKYSQLTNTCINCLIKKKIKPPKGRLRRELSDLSIKLVDDLKTQERN